MSESLPPPAAPPLLAPTPPPSEKDIRTWNMWCHLSALSGLMVPLGNLLGPLLVWQIKKHEFPGVEAHGKVALNWQLTVFIATVIGWAAGAKKKDPASQLLLAQEQEIQQLMTNFGAQTPDGLAVQRLEVLVRTAIFKPANALVQWLLQQASDRIGATYQPAPGQQRKGRARLRVDGLFGSFQLERDYHSQEGKNRGITQPMRRWVWRWATRPLWLG